MRPLMALRRLLAALPAFVLVFSLLVACGGGPKTEWPGPPKSEAEAAYRKALSTMESGQYVDATKQFNYVRLKFPYSSRWTSLAELRLADILLEQGRYAQAAESYKLFVQSHPTHEDVAYANYKLGICYHEQLPSAFFILPDPWQRDLTSALQAELAFRTFLKRHPDSKFAEDATTKLVEVVDRQAHHHLYVAEFYLKRDKFLGALNRTLYLAERYPDSSLMPDNLVLMAQAYILLNDIRAAAGALQRLLADHPDSDFAEDARQWILQANLADIPPMAIGKELQVQRQREGRSFNP